MRRGGKIVSPRFSGTNHWEVEMTGRKMSGLLLALTMMSGLMIPVSARAQGATADQYYAAGVQMYNSRNYTQALQYLNAAIKLNPNNAAAYQAAGNCYYAMGNKPYALTYYQRASALQPTNAQLAQFVRNLQAQSGGAPAAAAPNY